MPTDIHGTSQTSYTAPCNGIVSYGAQTGSLRVFADYSQKQTQNKCVHNLCKRLVFVNLHAQTAVDAVTYPPDEPWLF